MPILTTLGAACAKAWGFTSGLVKDQYFNLVSLLLPGNGTNGAQNNTFLDSSTNNFTITRNGNTTQGTFSPFSQTGWGNYFDGSSSLNVTTTAVFAASSEDFTIEFWVYRSSISDQMVCGYAGPNFDYLFLPSSGSIQLNANNTYTIDSGALSWQVNTWYHVAISRTSGVVKIFRNGGQVGSNISNSNSFGLAGNVRIADWQGGSPRYYVTGYVSNFRFVKGIGVYTGNFQSPITPLGVTQSAGTNILAISGAQTKLLMCQSNRFLDASGNATSITTQAGSPSVVAFSPFAPTAAYTTAAVGGSGYFDGTGDYLVTPNNAALTLGSGDFTIEMWIFCPNTANGNIQILYDQRSASGQTVPTIYLDTNGYLQYFVAGANKITYSTAVTSNAWNHIAISRSGSNTIMFLNGAQVGSTYTTLDTLAGNAVGIGAYLGTPSLYYTGYMSNLRVVKGTAVYTAAFTPPTAPLTAIANTQLLLNFTNAGITDATAKNDLETVGNAQIVSPTPSKFGGGSIAFDGTGDGLVSNATIGATAFGTGDFTIEFWAYITNTGVAQATIVDSRAFGSTSTTNQIYMLYTSTNNISFFTNGAYRINSSAITQNTWNHVALVRSSGSTKMYLNGVQTGSTYADTNNYAGNANRPVIGLDASDLSTFGFPGNIDDFRITRGYARYVTGTGANAGQMVFNGTNTLALPTAPFPVQ